GANRPLADRRRGSSRRTRGGDLPAQPAEDRGCGYGRHGRLDGDVPPRPDPRQLARTHALPVRQGPEREERVLGKVRELLAAPDCERQAAGRGRREGFPDWNDQARRRTTAGDLQPPPALYVRQRQSKGPDER